MPAATSSDTGTLTRDQIRAYAKGAGFPDDQLNMAVEVAMLESSGNPRALNSVPCYGLWQINMRGDMGTSRRKALGIASNDRLFDPAVNAKAAKLIYDQAGKSWSPWTTARRAKANLGSAAVGPDSSSSDASSDDAGSDASASITSVNPLNRAIDQFTEKFRNRAIDQFTEKFRLAALTYLVFLVALVLLILGVVILNRNTAVNAAMSLIPAGSAVKKVVKAVK